MERLKELRALKKLRQKDVAEALKIDRTTYAKYETGDSEPSNEILKKLANFYDVSVDYLIGHESETEASEYSVQEQQLVLVFRQLNQTGKNILLSNADSLLAQPALRQVESVQLGK